MSSQNKQKQTRLTYYYNDIKNKNNWQYMRKFKVGY